MNDIKLVVFSSLFPSTERPSAGLFIRERMFRVGKHVPITVISPVPWFPFQNIIRLWRPNFRPQPQRIEYQDDICVYFPRFLSVPGVFKCFDGFFMGLGAFLVLKKLKGENAFILIDAHFAYPDGYAATLLGKWFNVPVTITLRGTEVPLSKMPARKDRMMRALENATKVFAVADSLKQHVVKLGANAEKIEVVGNAVDTQKFFPIDKQEARQQLNLPENAKILVSVGGLVKRKGFHRVIEVLPGLLKNHPDLIFLIVGGNSPEGGIQKQLEHQVEQLGLQQHVRFLGMLPAEKLRIPLSAADLFVLATENEGWANVFLEAMACGLPVITTNVGGNSEVVCRPELGTIVPFGDANALEISLLEGLDKQWDKEKILDYARENNWDKRVDVLLKNFNQIINHYE